MELLTRSNFATVLKMCNLYITTAVGTIFAEDWTPEFSTTQGELKFYQAVTQKHSNLPSSNLQFRRNSMDVLFPIPSCLLREKIKGPIHFCQHI
jgi:hypothetical protein